MKVYGTNFASEIKTTNHMKTESVIRSAVVSITTLVQTDVKDSIVAKHLNEGIVEAQMQRTRASVSLYYPGRNTKRTAQNAIDLLK